MAMLTTVRTTMVTAVESTERYVAGTGLSPSHPSSPFNFTTTSPGRTITTPISHVIRPHTTQPGRVT